MTASSGQPFIPWSPAAEENAAIVCARERTALWISRQFYVVAPKHLCTTSAKLSGRSEAEAE